MCPLGPGWCEQYDVGTRIVRNVDQAGGEEFESMLNVKALGLITSGLLHLDHAVEKSAWSRAKSVITLPTTSVSMIS